MTNSIEPTDEMYEAGYNVLKEIHAGPFGGSPSLGHAGKVYRAMLDAAPKAKPGQQNSIDLLRIAADNGLQIFCPDAESNAVVRWYPWDEKSRVSADAGDCVSQGLQVNNYSMTCIAIKKALVARGIPQSTGDAVAEPSWPKERDIGRYGDMSPHAHIRVGFDSDNDVYVSVWDENGGASIEFCQPGAGGGKSSRTRMALIALMVAMEADNADTPALDWWARRNGTAKP